MAEEPSSFKFISVIFISSKTDFFKALEATLDEMAGEQRLLSCLSLSFSSHVSGSMTFYQSLYFSLSKV